MGITTEKRLFRLEEELKALKATYTISGGRIKLYESVSPVFTISQDYLTSETVIRFTPNYSSVDHMIIPSIYYEFVDENGASYNFSNYVRIEPQNNNFVLLHMPTFGGTVQLKIISNIPGTFTLIQ